MVALTYSDISTSSQPEATRQVLSCKGASVAVGFGVGVLMSAVIAVGFCGAGDKMFDEVLLQAEPNNVRHSITRENGLIWCIRSILC